jgi:hypothetical protein
MVFRCAIPHVVRPVTRSVRHTYLSFVYKQGARIGEANRALA